MKFSLSDLAKHEATLAYSYVRYQSLRVILVRKNFCGAPFRLCRANTLVWSVVQRHEAILRYR